jgi:HEAT repeat protein
MKRTFLAIVIFIYVSVFGYNLIARAETNTSRILVCSEIYRAMGKIGGVSVKGILLKGVTDNEFFIRAYAAEALGLLNDKDVIPALKDLTKDDNYFVKLVATTALLKLGGVKEESLLNFLKDKKPEVRSNAVAQLSVFGDKYLSVILKVLSSDDNDLVRAGAVAVLGTSGFNQAIGEIMRLLENENPLLRQAACSILGQNNYKQAIPQLNKRLNDKDTRVRASAKVALSQMGERSIIGLLWEDIKSKDEYLRGSSYTALANLKEIDVLPIALKELVAPGNTTFVRAQVAGALRILRPYVSELSNKALASLNIGSLSAANLEMNFNYKVDGRTLTLILMDALRDSNNPLHRDAPSIINVLQDRDCLPVLRQALSADDPDMVAAVAYALGDLQDAEALKYLLEAYKKYGCGKI